MRAMRLSLGLIVLLALAFPAAAQADTPTSRTLYEDGPEGRELDEAVWTDGASIESDEVITGYYLVEADEEVARQLAVLIPTGGHIEWRRIFPFDGG